MRLISLEDAAVLKNEAWSLYESSFPHYERWGEEAFGRASADPAFITKLAVGDSDELMALLYYWNYESTLYIEYIAVDPALRGQNIGTKLIEKLIRENPDRKVILEIDPPEDEVSIRRRHFYERMGFVLNEHEHIHPSYVSGEGAYPHRLVLMSHGGIMTEGEFSEFRGFLLGILEKYGD